MSIVRETQILIDFEVLEATYLTPSQYTFLYLMHKGDNPQEIQNLCGINTGDLDKLQAMGYIKILPESQSGYNRIILRQKGIDLFEVSNPEQKWLEFKASYPRKAGGRMLHDQQERCKTKYLALIKNIGMHEKIMTGLKNEQIARIKAAENKQFMPEWKAMSAWLHQKHWEPYLEYSTPVDKDLEERL